MGNKRKNLFLFSLITFLVISLFSVNANKAMAETDPLNLKAEAAILIDADSGKVLYEKNADKLLGVASMSKMMTEYLVLEAISDGKISWDQQVTISEFIHKLSSPNLGLSTVGLTEGEAYTVKELYESMAIHSANASTVALAELIGGSEANFVKMMNEKAEEMGLEDDDFVTSSGLNNSDMLGNHPQGTDVNDENQMSARATAKLAYNLIKDYPEVLETASKPELEFRGETYKNFNWMLPGLVYEYEGVDGIKTGSTDFAGYNFTATAERDGLRFISVVMKTGSQQERFEDTRKLLDYAFSNFKKEEIVPKNSSIKGYKTLPVEKGKKDSVKIVAKEPLNVVIKNGENEQYKPKIVLNEKKVDENDKLTAPVEKVEVVGYLTYETEKDGDYLYPNQKAQVEVVAAESVDKANWLVLLFRSIGNFFSNLWSGIVSVVAGWF